MLKVSPWQPGMSPRLHPLYRDQLALEVDMVRRGAEAFRAQVAAARDPGAAKDKPGRYDPEMTRVQAFRRVMQGLVRDAAGAFKVWSDEYQRRAPQMRPAGFEKLLGIKPETVAFLAVRTILDACTVQILTLTAVSHRIGMAVQQEQRMQAWIKSEPGLWKQIQQGLDDQKATDDHRKKVNTNRFNTLVKDKIGWRDWTKEDMIRVGSLVVGVLVRATKGGIKVEEADVDLHPTGKGNGAYIVVLSEELRAQIAKGLERDETMLPAYMPTIMPPRRWTSMKRGGYYGKFVHVPSLIRFRADSPLAQEDALEEYNSLDMPRVYAAVHALQETPWRINQKVLSVALAIWDKDLGIAGITRREDRPLPPKTAAIEKALKTWKDYDRKVLRKLSPDDRSAAMKKLPKRIAAAREEAREWRSEAANVHAENARRISHTNAARETIQLAARFKDREFYFPHMLDFRGRMYPIPMYLQPQGHDLARGLLTFGMGKPVGTDDAGWLAIHLANCWGNDKVSNDERIQWVDGMQATWLRIADNPLGSLEWTQSDDPWQTLAAIFEWVRWLREGPGMVSSMPIRVDGTCNGIQHLSAMMRDPVGGASVNLLASDSPRDIYKEVADQLLLDLGGIKDSLGEAGKKALWWIEHFTGGIPRALTKNPVMVLPYGGTRDSYFGSIHKWCMKTDPQEKHFPRQEKLEHVPFLRDVMWNAVDKKVVKAKECMEWLKEVAEVVACTGLPIYWTTPTGFHVRHFYGAQKSKQIETRIDGKRMQLKVNTRSSTLAKREQLQGISPNFVHSMDASCNMETVLLFTEQNEDDPPPFTSIHDAYGTVAGCMWSLFGCLREAFIRVHRNDVLENFRERAVLMYRDHLFASDPAKSFELCWEIAEDTIKRVPERGDLDIEEVRNSDYFFA